QEGSDLVSDERIERAVTYLQICQRVSLRDFEPQACREHVVETGYARTATTRVEGAHVARTGVLREERRRSLDADCDLFAARLDHGVEMRRTVETLNELLRRVGREAPLALNVFTNAPRADGQIARQHRNTFF